MVKERLELVPVDLGVANDFVERHHRHRNPVVGHMWSTGAVLAGKLIGVSIIGRPVSRVLDDGFTVEIIRLATDSVKYPTGRRNRKGELTFHNPCSFLSGAAARAAFARGFRKVVTYTLLSESGASLRAAAFMVVAEVKGRTWSCKSRPRIDHYDLENKLRWEAEGGAE